jgi:hypothetical protein
MKADNILRLYNKESLQQALEEAEASPDIS